MTGNTLGPKSKLTGAGKNVICDRTQDFIVRYILVFS